MFVHQLHKTWKLEGKRLRNGAPSREKEERNSFLKPREIKRNGK
jgi:hypothetical protein